MNKKRAVSILVKIVHFSLKGNANSTTCISIFQPKAPDELKKFSKIENDK